MHFWEFSQWMDHVGEKPIDVPTPVRIPEILGLFGEPSGREREPEPRLRYYHLTAAEAPGHTVLSLSGEQCLDDCIG